MLEVNLTAVLDRKRTGAIGILRTGLLPVHDAETWHSRIRHRRVDRAAIHGDGAGVGSVCRIIAPHARADRDACGKIFRIATDATSRAINDVVGVEDSIGLDDDLRSDGRRIRRMDTAAANARRIAAPVRDQRAGFDHHLASSHDIAGV